MLIPELFYALGRKTTNSKWLGDVIRASCGQKVKLDSSQAAVVAVCRECFDEVQRRRDAERLRKAAYRAVKGKAK